jgi:hypothetical protein
LSISGLKKKKKQGEPYFFSYVKAISCLLAMLLIRYGQLLATLSAAACQYATTIGSSHSLTETMLVSTAAVRGLECSFHSYVFVYLFSPYAFRGAKLHTFL